MSEVGSVVLSVGRFVRSIISVEPPDLQELGSAWCGGRREAVRAVNAGV